MKCPKCNKSDMVQKGLIFEGKTEFYCRRCEHAFVVTPKEEIKAAVLEYRIKNIKTMLRCVKSDLKADGTFDLACNGCNEQSLCGELKRRIETGIKTATNRIK